jgi:RND family efflux transporter MFP subunit
MRFVKTAFVWAFLFLAALLGWAIFLPASQPILDRAGLWEPMRAIGIPVAEAPANGAPGGGGGPPFGGGGGAERVIAQEVTMVEFGDRLGAIGTAEALRSVILTPDVGGRLSALHVRSGDQVRAGDLIAEIDAEPQRLAITRAEIALQDAQARADRVGRLRDSGTATDVQIDDAAVALRQAELDLAEAEFELTRRQIVAPFDGYVGLISLEPGNQVTTGTEIARLDDRARLRVNFEVPERLVGLIGAGDAFEYSPLSRPADISTGQVRAVDARVSQDNRALRIEGEIDNSDDRLRPGMAFRVTVLLPGEDYPAIDPLTVQWDRRGSFVWAVAEDDTARRVGIDIVQRRDEAVLVRADLTAGDLIVLEGVQNLRPGAPVAVAEVRGRSADTASATDTADTTPDI